MLLFSITVLCLSNTLSVNAFVPTTPQGQRASTSHLFLSELPQGISPFEKANAKNLDVAGDFHRRALKAFNAARKDNIKLLEIEFPPNLFTGKTSFDDFDNVQELDLNRDWCVGWLPQLPERTIWFLLPDTKECQLAKEVWQGSKYRSAAAFTTIEQVTQKYTDGKGYSKPWGANFADSVAKVFTGVLGDESALDALNVDADLHVVCQPGNGGPVEDWINCEILHNNANNPEAATVLVNGALDKVRDGYYPGVFFPALAGTVDRFYKRFESIFYLKPISDKGVYGWLFREYPEVRLQGGECWLGLCFASLHIQVQYLTCASPFHSCLSRTPQPWQVVLQTVETKNNKQVVTNSVVYTSEKRPTYLEAVDKLLSNAGSISQM